jgi:hypothetical protein
VQIIYSTPGWLRPREEHVHQTGARRTPNFRINKFKKMRQRAHRCGRQLNSIALTRQQRQLAAHLRDIKARRIQANEPRRSLRLHAQDVPGYRYIVFGGDTPIRVTFAASSPDSFSDACGKDRDTYKEGQAGRERRPPVARVMKGARVTPSSTGHCDPTTAQAAQPTQGTKERT